MYGPGHQFTSEHAILLHAHMQFIFYYRLCIISLSVHVYTVQWQSINNIQFQIKGCKITLMQRLLVSECRTSALL